MSRRLPSPNDPWYATHVVRDWIAFFLGVFLIVFDVLSDEDHTLEHDIAMWSVALILMGMASASRFWFREGGGNNDKEKM